MAETKHIAKAPPKTRTPKKRLKKTRKWWVWALWILCVLVFILLIGAVVAWSNRYAILEDMAIDSFAQDGIEAELEIETLNRHQAVLNDVKLTYDGQVFFAAKQIEADYAWRNALNGEMQSVTITQPRAHITLDNSGKIIDGWLPPSNPKDSGATDDNPLPENGLTLKDSTFFIQSPYGAGQVSGDVHLKSPQAFTAALSLKPSELSYNDIEMSGGGTFNVDTLGDTAQLTGQFALSKVNGPGINAKDITLNLNGVPDTEAQSFIGTASLGFSSIENAQAAIGKSQMDWDGKLDLKAEVLTGKASLGFASIESPQASIGKSQIDWDGTLNRKTQSFTGQALVNVGALETAQLFLNAGQIDWDGTAAKTDDLVDLYGDWSASLKAARIPDPARREALAETLSFHAALSKSPVAQNFVPQVRSAVLSLLAGSDVNARGDVHRNSEAFKLTLAAPARIKSDETELTLVPHSVSPAYNFNRAEQRITAALDASFTQPAGLSLTDVNFEARSINGVRLDSVEAFSAQVKTNAQWQSYGLDGRPARLSPLLLDMRYNGANPAQRNVDLSGAVDYDGLLPGGYVKGLKLAGDMGLRLSNKGKMTIGYTPKAASRLRIDSLETATDWTAYNLEADIAPSDSLLIRRANGESVVSAVLSNVTTQARHEPELANLDVNAKTLTANGRLASANGEPKILIQNWDAKFTQALITSDDLPGPDTKITIAEGQLDADLTTGQSPNFDLSTPSANVETQLVKVDNMALRLHGQADNYDIEHSGGHVKLIGNELPPLPFEGSLTAKDGVLIGTAKARLPQADNTPISMTYNIRDGAGYADVDIEALQFSPNGLQPKNLISAMRGKVAQVDGIASAKIHLEFARGQPLKSSGTAKIINMNLGTAPGPLTGMNMELTMDSVLPLISRGKQRITVAQFDPGIPLQDGVIDFELVDDGVKIYSAKWPFGNGFFSLDPFTWQYGAEENRVVMRLDNVQLGQFIENLGNDSIEATGQLQGEFPIVISGVNLRVDKGHIIIKDGGTIRYNPPQAGGTPPETYTQEEALKILRTKDQARYSSLARDALREFQYDELSVKVDGSLDGEVELGTVFSGSNEKVLNGQPFEFDINIVGELFNIVRSFDSNAQIKSQLEKQGISTKGLAITPN